MPRSDDDHARPPDVRADGSSRRSHVALSAFALVLIAAGATWIGGKGACEECCEVEGAVVVGGPFGGALLDTSSFPPRWSCGEWTVAHGWLHIGSDLAIWAAYMGIPIVLVILLRRRKDLPFPSVLWLFCAFVLACGITHLLEAVMFRWPAYRLMGSVKAATAVVSWATVFALLRVLPRALALENPLALRLSALEQSSADAIVGKSADGTITSWNPAAERLFGYAPEEVIGRSTELLVPPDLLDEHRRLAADVAAGRSLGRLDTLRVAKDGSTVPVALFVVPLMDARGSFDGSIVVYSDVTEQRRASERVRLALEAAPNGMLLVDDRGRIALVNSTAEAMFGYRREELIGEPVETLVPPAARAGHPAKRGAYFAKPHARRMGEGRELEAARKDGSLFPVEIGLNPMSTTEGNFVLAAVVDITERKRAERELERKSRKLERTNEELERFAYAAAHDLKAPLQAIRSLSQWILEDLEGKVEAGTRRHLELMESRVDRLDGLLDGLLTYARAGRDEGPLEELDLEATVREVAETLSLPDGFEVRTSGELPTLRSVAAPLELVLRNLVGNAVKHHDRARGVVRVSHLSLEGRVEVAVTDDGPGIDPEHHERIFGMFQTLRPRDEVEGGGLGLSMVQKVVEAQGGEIRVEAAAPRGTTFRFTWPDGSADPRAAA